MKTKKEEELWELIQQKEAESKELRKQLFELTQKDEEAKLREKYLGKYYLHKEYNDRWITYIHVNDLDINNRLNCTLFTIIYEDKNNEVYGVSCESNYDFSCHYLSTYDDEPSINECVEVTREEFLKEYEKFSAIYLKSFEQ